MLAIPTQNKRRGGGKKKEEENHSDVHCEGANEITQGFSLDRKQDDQWRHHQDFLSTLGRGYRRLAETSRAGSKSDHREISPLLTGQRVAVQIYLQSFSKFARRGRKDVEIFSDAGVEESQDFKKEVLDWELQHLLDVMLPSGDLVLQLINDILDLSKVDSGVIKLEATKFRPREVIKHDLQTVAASLRKFLVLEGI